MSDLSTLANKFQRFNPEYSFAPLWFWNDDIREEEVVRQLKAMKDQHVHETIIWCNAGLNQRYLSEEYFELFTFAVEQAKKLDMGVWVYDDWSWPSGPAGGVINEAHPEYLMTACRVYRYGVRGGEELVKRLPVGRVVRCEAERAGDGKRIDLETFCDDTSLRWAAPDGDWRVHLAVVTPLQHVLDPTCTSRWGNWLPGYLDVMNREAVAKFVELTYQAHYDRCSEHYGKTIRGTFTDEPGTFYDHAIKGGLDTVHSRHGFPWKDQPLNHDHPNLHGLIGTISWTADLFHHFRDRRGYDLRPRLLDLVRAGDEHRKLCYDFTSLLSDLFAESWCEQIADWCGQRNVAYSGHYNEGVNGGDYYRQIGPQQVPAMDILGDHGVEMKDLMALPRKVASVARMKGRPRTLSETYSDTSWDFNLHDKTRDADLLTVLGINTHASIDYTYSFRSIRKHTTNPAGFVQASNWGYNHHFADHVTRLCQMTAAGESAVDLAIVYGSHAALSGALVDHVANDQLEKDTDNVFKMLMSAQIESDIIFDTGLPEGKVSDGTLQYPGATYRTLILANVPRLRREHATILVDFVNSGGHLVVFKQLPLETPEGEDLSDLWSPLVEPRKIEQLRDVESLETRGGRLTLVPDFLRCLTSHDAPRTGQAEALFDRSDTMVVYPRVPQWLAFDFGEQLTLSGVEFTVEGMKQEIAYDYTLEASSDGREWSTVKQVSGQAGLVHRHDLDGVKARHLRITFTEGGGRYISLTDLVIRHETSGGGDAIWAPAGCEPLLMARVLPDHRPKLELLDEDEGGGERLRCFTTAWRRVEGADVVAIANRSPREQQVTAVLHEAGRAVEDWDLDSGRRRRIVAGDDRFTMTLSPYESRLLVLRPEAEVQTQEPARADRRRESVAESAGPWPAARDRANAVPLVGLGLEMADPAYPDDWQATEDGSIPVPLREVPIVLFRCTVQVGDVPASARLLAEEGLVERVKINGHGLGGGPYGQVNDPWSRDRYLDPFGISADITSLLKAGENTITGLFQPEMYERNMAGTWYHKDNIQPTLDAFILGDFGFQDQRIVAPAAELDASPWEHQGMRYYSGGVTYQVTLNVPDDAAAASDGRPLWLEVDCRENVVELLKDGRSLGTRITYPFLIDVSDAVTPGENRFELRITNPVGSLLSAQKTHSWKGKIELDFRSGLQWVKLVRPTAS